MQIIACVDRSWGIGFENKLLFDLPVDKAFFKGKTSSKTIVMGRKTWDSLPLQPLPMRTNVILSKSIKHTNGAIVFDDVSLFLQQVKQDTKQNYQKQIKASKIIASKIKSQANKEIVNNEDFVLDTRRTLVIGGQSVYTQLLPYCNKAYITKVYACKHADTFMPNLDDMQEWICTKTKISYCNGYSLSFCEYDRVVKN